MPLPVSPFAVPATVSSPAPAAGFEGELLRAAPPLADAPIPPEPIDFQSVLATLTGFARPQGEHNAVDALAPVQVTLIESDSAAGPAQEELLRIPVAQLPGKFAPVIALLRAQLPAKGVSIEGPASTEVCLPCYGELAADGATIAVVERESELADSSLALPPAILLHEVIPAAELDQPVAPVEESAPNAPRLPEISGEVSTTFLAGRLVVASSDGPRVGPAESVLATEEVAGGDDAASEPVEFVIVPPSIRVSPPTLPDSRDVVIDADEGIGIDSESEQVSVPADVFRRFPVTVPVVQATPVAGANTAESLGVVGTAAIPRPVPRIALASPRIAPSQNPAAETAPHIAPARPLVLREAASAPFAIDPQPAAAQALDGVETSQQSGMPKHAAGTLTSIPESAIRLSSGERDQTPAGLPPQANEAARPPLSKPAITPAVFQARSRDVAATNPVPPPVPGAQPAPVATRISVAELRRGESEPLEINDALQPPAVAPRETPLALHPVASPGSVGSLPVAAGDNAPQFSPQQAAAALDQVVAEVLSRADVSHDPASGRFEFRLDPPELGEVTIEFHRSDRGAIHVQVTAAQPQTRAALEQQLGEITRGLQDSGLQLAEFDLAQRHDQHSRQQDWEDTAQRARLTRAWRIDNPAASSDHPPHVRPQYSGFSFRA